MQPPSSILALHPAHFFCRAIMKSHCSCHSILPGLVALAVLAGCSSSKPAATHSDEKKTEANTAAPSAEKSASEKSTADKVTDNSPAPKSDPALTADPSKGPAKNAPFKLGDLIAPFAPPSLAEIDKMAGWIDNPV